MSKFSGLSFDVLQHATALRSPLFGEKCENWVLGQWSNAMLSEGGEAGNVIKKIERGDFDLEQGRAQIADELADMLTYAAALANKAGIDLGEAVVAKFNQVSYARGFPITIQTDMHNLFYVETDKIDRQLDEATKKSLKNERSLRQFRATKWCKAVFGQFLTYSWVERAARFYEEATELVQKLGLTREMAHRIVDYVYDRPVGEIYEEIGAAGLCLLILGSACGVDVDQAEEFELQRVLAMNAEKLHAKWTIKQAAGITSTQDEAPWANPVK